MKQYKLTYQQFSNPLPDLPGTIRTTPENYYVADVNELGELIFKDLEAQTWNMDRQRVRDWWKANRPAKLFKTVT